MAENIDMVNYISTLLDSGKYKEALGAVNEDRFAKSFKDNCWDLIAVVIGKIEDDTIIIKPSMYGACEQLLVIIIEKCSPEEALLEFIEQIELAKNDAQFGLVLQPLQDLLKKMSVKRGRSLEWCLNSIITYIEKIPIPDHQLEGQERLLMDSDINMRRVTRVYTLLPPFYKHFMKELDENDTNNKTKQIITAFLISLLGKPVIYLDLDPETNDKSEARLTCSMIIQDICTLEKNVLKFLELVEVCYREGLKKSVSKQDNEDEKLPYEHKEKINMTTLSGLFYAVFSGHFAIPELAVPQVYRLDYVLNTVMLCSVHLLSFPEYGPLAKAIALCNAVVDRFPQKMSYDLFSPIHIDMCKGLTNVAIYSSYEILRKQALAAIECHINKFDYKGRCTLIKYLIELSNHSGMIGYAITLYKNSINESYAQPKLDECFTGAQLSTMIKKICFLPHGAESDLVELADQIISALNFLRYLAIKDIENHTGIRDNFMYIENIYLEQLRTGLNMSKAHYEVKLQDIEENDVPGEELNVSINVGGNVLDKIPKENKKEILCSALNAFHLIEGLIARLSECINVNKMQALKNGQRIVGTLAVAINKRQGLIRSYCQNSFEKELKPATVVTEHEEHQYEENVKNRILEKALQFVPKSGWSIESLSSGAKAVGYPTITHGLFPNGGADLVHYFNIKCNEKLVDQMKSWPSEELKDSKVPAKFVENAIMTRLLMIDPYKSTWPKAMALQTLPNNVPNCLATLLSLVDDICYHSGDRSVDFNWYARRVGLAGIYKAAELFYLTDSSSESTSTRNFVASRIRDAQLIQTALNLNPVSAAPQTLTAAFTTAKNILGMNTLK
ncbi:unnamed protein product [Arctia plantaginis]|uniref:Ubiquinone biosynthesis protein n=1 Tax=Arctia plantaginis TaxID=874455 RepID=A0A8S1BME8_ARCPL|nr:unnamed protein product [Arctia plantaginis]